jgi:hypothetical protein
MPTLVLSLGRMIGNHVQPSSLRRSSEDADSMIDKEADRVAWEATIERT